MRTSRRRVVTQNSGGKKHLRLRPKRRLLHWSHLRLVVQPAALKNKLDQSSAESTGLFSSSGRRSARPHDPEEGVDVVALDGVPAGGNHLVLGFPHWTEQNQRDFIIQLQYRQ